VFSAYGHFRGHDDEARAAYRRAPELATSTPERRFLTRRLEKLEPGCPLGGCSFVAWV
jgi:hypothetical protein